MTKMAKRKETCLAMKLWPNVSTRSSASSSQSVSRSTRRLSTVWRKISKRRQGASTKLCWTSSLRFSSTTTTATGNLRISNSRTSSTLRPPTGRTSWKRWPLSCKSALTKSTEWGSPTTITPSSSIGRVSGPCRAAFHPAQSITVTNLNQRLSNWTRVHHSKSKSNSNHCLSSKIQPATKKIKCQKNLSLSLLRLKINRLRLLTKSKRKRTSSLIRRRVNRSSLWSKTQWLPSLKMRCT